MNDNVKHTPGPWKVSAGNLGVVVVKNDRWRIEIGDYDHGNDLADARLIAAAPDLLTAAQALLGEADSTGGHTRTVSRLSVDRLRAAIEKAATGGEEKP